jgi:hypothetical protein
LRNQIDYQDQQLKKMADEKRTLMKIKQNQESHLKKIESERANFLKVAFPTLLIPGPQIRRNDQEPQRRAEEARERKTDGHP